MAEQTGLAIAKDYPQDKYNLLIPVKTMQELSPLHKIVVNEVSISADPNTKDVYKEKNGELALTKRSLMKLMAAANIQIIESKSVPTQRCNKCIEIAGKTRLAPKCNECQYIDDVAYQVTIAVPEPSGTYRRITATKELRMEDEKTKAASDAQFKQFKPFRTEHCESKALNRALREGLMIKSSYKADELKKPFAVALVMPNFNDPDFKKAMIANYSNNATALFGGTAGNQLALESPAIEIPIDEPEIESAGEMVIVTEETAPINVEVTVVDLDEPEFVMTDGANCSVCGCDIMETKVKNKVWSIQDIIDYSVGHYNKLMCLKCCVQLSETKGGNNHQ